MSFTNIWDLSHTVDIKHKNLANEILLSRDIPDMERYLYPKLEDLHDPFLFVCMKKAVTRILQSIKNEEAILIYGDYDTDGITATAILYRFLSQIGGNIQYYIPDRKSEGYGLSIEVLEDVLDEQVGLIITVDCGITAINEVDFINDIGIDCIISDHHTPLEELPRAYCIISPLVEDSGYPYKQLSGAGIAFKIIHAISLELGKGYENEYAKYIELAAIGTIADIVPLKGENRTIAKIGMEKLSFTDNTGLKTLISQSYPNGTGRVNSSQLLFNIIPKLNAAGRMSNAEHSLRLLISDDIEECMQLSELLLELNLERQLLQKEIVCQVFETIEANGNIKNQRIIVLANEKWDRGVLGIVASHVTERYNRPCILMEMLEEGIAKGSARSIPGFNLIAAISDCSKNLLSYGGHKMAAGLSMKKEYIQEFSEMINEFAKSHGYDVNDKKTSCPDFEIDIEDITLKNAEIMSCMEPYGCENELSLFYLNKMEFCDIKTIGKNQEHLRITFKKNNKYLYCIYFGSSDYRKLFIPNIYYDIIFKLSCSSVNDSNFNNLNTKKYVNCQIIDLRFSDEKDDIIDNLLAYSKSAIQIDREAVAKVYMTIQSNKIPHKYYIKDIPDLAVFLICLDILQELCIIKYNNVNFEHIYITEINNENKKDLNQSSTFLKVNANGSL